jgi:hypothetical protein
MIKIPESIKLVFFILLFSTIYGYVSDDDYHKVFDIPELVRYNCDMVQNNWSPNIPPDVVDECIKMKENDAKTY